MGCVWISCLHVCLYTIFMSLEAKWGQQILWSLKVLSSMDNIFLEVLLACEHDDILYPTSHDYVVQLKMTAVYAEIAFHDHQFFITGQLPHSGMLQGFWVETAIFRWTHKDKMAIFPLCNFPVTESWFLETSLISIKLPIWGGKKMMRHSMIISLTKNHVTAHWSRNRGSHPIITTGENWYCIARCWWIKKKSSGKQE